MESEFGSVQELLEIFVSKYEAVSTRDSLLKHIQEEAGLQNQGTVDDDIEACRDFSTFIKRAWHVVEPSNPYIHGWHIDALADHLKAVSNGEILRLLINIPPGTAKSLIVSVFWPAWEWGPADMPTLRFLSTSYSADYVARDSRRMRDLVTSAWYVRRWPHIKLVRHGEVSFENTLKGFREGVPFSRMTGGRGHRVIIDDPHSTEMAESEAERDTTTRIFKESVPTRLVEPKTSAIVVIMQRLHVDDVSGVALSFKLEPYVHLCLPMRFEVSRRCFTKIGFQDPRVHEGELLFPQRFPQAVVDRDESVMGSFAVAGQNQQCPTIREGGMFKREWFKVVKLVPPGTRFIRFWDLAASEEQLNSKAAYTAGVLLGRQPNGRFIITDISRGRAEGLGVRRMMRTAAKEDGPMVEIGFPQDPGQAGKAQAQDMIRMLAGFIVSSVRETGDKVQRAEPVASQAEAGNIDILEGAWNADFLDEVNDFPGGKFKDQVDALSGAFNKLIGTTVFNASEDTIAMEPIRIPSLYQRVCGLYMDRQYVTMVWAAYDRATETTYIYDSLTHPKMDLAIHANQMRTRGPWIPTVFRLIGEIRTREEGSRITEQLMKMFVPIIPLDYDEEAALTIFGEKLSARTLRVHDNNQEWFAAYRRLHRDERGKLTGDDTGMIQATAMVLMMGLDVAVTETMATALARQESDSDEDRNATTGY